MPSPRRRWALLLALLAALLLGGCGADAAAPAPTVSAQPAQTLPTWVDLPSIGARSSLVPLGLNADRTVEVPPVDQPLQAGWYRYSPAPGDVGPAVILGHIDGNHQQGIFWRLHDVKPGDRVQVGRADGSTLTFEVTKVDQVAKSEFPTDAVYGDTADPQLRLITCGGAYDAAHHNYLDNVIVYAKLA
ncbi:LPXTG-site transpeptidase (sortase) family protein [Amycolatopsis bartoniae]|uniref:Class F sortase n=1 Tax=Amycolatopsis bartoniae TaxID=941986 RepID=A0A8H9IU80_9PSEU|nr:class F sortase [Amycolatopsis bartoniae]MBB2938233.1 LPXTG-site transpeptidase (sortase) family protein [Amycolatopsis bartoniae]TVT09013.1 class F sortase [Amycolatopsis bartoniae]GHF33661.1 class F sortase [Amycolatopsis bartoniae]